MSSYLDNLSQFDEATIQRGEAYFKQQRVRILSSSPSQVIAEVTGSEVYRVTLRFGKDKRLLSSGCDCPCQYPCKHVVAVLYYLDNQELSHAEEALTPAGLSARLEKAKLAHNDFDYYTLGQILTISLASFPSKEEQKAAVRLYDSYAGSFSSNPRYDFKGVIVRLMKALSLSGSESKAFFKDFLEDKTIDEGTKTLLFRSLVDEGGVGRYFDSAFVEVYREDPLTYAHYLSDSRLFFTDIRKIPDELLAVYLPQNPHAFTPYALVDRLPSLGPDSDENSFRVYLAIVQALKENRFVGDIPRDSVKTLFDLGHPSEAKAVASLLFQADGSLDGYLPYRQLLKDPLSEADQRQLRSSALTSTSREAIFLYESGLAFLPNPKFKDISLHDYALIGAHYSPRYQAEVVGAISEKIEHALGLQKGSNDVADGLVALSQVAPEKVKAYLQDPRVESKSHGLPLFRAAYLRLCLSYGLLAEQGLHLYESEAPHVSR